MRCSLCCKPNTHIAFQPSALPDSQLATGELKRNTLGAVYAGSFEKIDVAENLEIFWECSVQVQAPASIKPLKPKAYLACHAELEANMYYQLI